MRYLVLVSALTLAAVAAAPASAGGWATVALASTPEGVSAGETWEAQITVLRHGVTPTDGAAPSMTIHNADAGLHETFAAESTGDTGVYVARIVFPEPGSWSFEIDNGLMATGYGESATTTYAPVMIDAGPGGGGSFPAVPLGVAAAIALAAAVAYGARRLRKLTPASS
ncbi:MAG: FixH family protein [Gaiellaceae bacterium]